MKVLRELILTHKSLLITLLAFVISYGSSYAAGSKKTISLDNTDFVVLISFLIFVGVYLAPSGRSSQKKEDNGSLEESFVNNMLR